MELLFLEPVFKEAIWGGTKLRDSFGYDIPRTSLEQSAYGTKVSASSIKQGDLVFYQSGKTVGHVALYIGDGEVIHASNEKDGIKISKMNYRTPYCIRRIV